MPTIDEIIDRKPKRQAYPFDAPWKEAAWFVVKQFMHSFDWSKTTVNPVTGLSAVLPAHNNESFLRIVRPRHPVAADLLTEELLWQKEPVKGFSRAMFDAHLEGYAKYYFRSRDFVVVRTGYQSYDDGYKKLPFDATLLGIDGKVNKWKGLKTVIAVLDIDDKLKLGIAGPVCQWLLDNYFPNAYYEPSTGGHGIHLYIKLVMARHEPIFQVRLWMDSFTKYLADELAEWLLSANNPSFQVLNEHQDMLCSQCRCNSLNECIIPLSYSTLDRVCGLPTCFNSKNHIKRGICIRVPLFPYKMESVIAFNNQPCILYHPWMEKMNKKMQLPVRKRQIHKEYNRVSPIGRTELIEEEKDSPEAPEGAYERTLYYLLKVCRQERRVLSVEEGMKAYEESGLATGYGESERKEREYRVSKALSFIAGTFESKKVAGTKFNYSLKTEGNDESVTHIFTSESTRRYRDGERDRLIKIDELKLIYNLFKANVDAGYRSGLSAEMVNRILIENGLSKALKVAKAVRAKLVQYGFIVPVAHAIPGVRGVVFRPGTPSPTPLTSRLDRDAEERLDEIIGSSLLALVK